MKYTFKYIYIYTYIYTVRARPKFYFSHLGWNGVGLKEKDETSHNRLPTAATGHGTELGTGHVFRRPVHSRSGFGINVWKRFGKVSWDLTGVLLDVVHLAPRSGTSLYTLCFAPLSPLHLNCW